MHSMSTRTICIVFLSAFVSFSAVSQTKYQKAIRFFDDGKIEQSKELFLDVVKEDPRNPEALYYLGWLTLNSDYEKAIEYLENAIHLNGVIAKYHLMLGNAFGIKAQRAGIFAKMGAASNCKEQYLTAISLDAKLTEARVNMIEFYLQAPGIVGGSVEKAAAQADTIKQYDPYAGYIAEARIHDYQKEKEKQEECYRKAISIDPKKVSAYKSLWLLAMGENDGTKADAVFKKAAAAVENKSDLYFQAGLYYLEKSDFAKARSMFEEALKRDPLNSAVYYQYGKLALLSGTDLYQGLVYFEKFLKMPQAKNAPSIDNTYWRMGMIYEKLGKADSARIAYRKSLELNPNHENAKKALEKLN
jgi:tetratricopeptide (TPR) repeat protein